MEKEKVSEHFIRLGMSKTMQQRINSWRVANLDENGNPPSFSEACRLLIDRSLPDE